MPIFYLHWTICLTLERVCYILPLSPFPEKEYMLLSIFCGGGANYPLHLLSGVLLREAYLIFFLVLEFSFQYFEEEPPMKI